MEAIKTSGLTKYYGRSRGITDLDLSVESGECFGFIGPNGAGKSTTVRTLLGFISPTAGIGNVLGKDIVKDREEILKRVGYLPSEVVFYPGMKVRDILKLSADLRKKNCDKTSASLCERLQLDTSRKIDELSFGNRKKAAIVCALQSDPELLILDEPTSGLDPLMQREFFEIIKDRSKNGTTVFLSSHILSEVQKNCDRAAIIKDGRIIACGSVETLARSNAKRISLHGSVDISGLNGVKDYKSDGVSASFLYSGDMNSMIKRLSEGNITDLNISDPELSEIFLHYYEKEGDAK